MRARLATVWSREWPTSSWKALTPSLSIVQAASAYTSALHRRASSSALSASADSPKHAFAFIWNFSGAPRFCAKASPLVMM